MMHEWEGARVEGRAELRAQESLCVKFEMVHIEDHCAISHGPALVNGPTLYLMDTWDPVCLACGRERSADLAACVELARADRERILRETLEE